MILLDEIIEAIGADTAEGVWFLDLKDAVLVVASQSALDLAITGKLKKEEVANAPETVQSALSVITDTTGRYLPLPGRLDVIEWNIMRKFAVGLSDQNLSAEIVNALSEQNAFQVFAAIIRKHKMQQNWNDFREIELRAVALEWCAANGLTVE